MMTRLPAFLLFCLLGVPLWLGAAENVKTVSGVAIANVKTITGVANANVKTITGVDSSAGGDPNLVFQETFENTGSPGYDNTWNETVGAGTTIDENSTTSVVEGSQNLQLIRAAATCTTWADIGSDETGIVRMVFRLNTSLVNLNNVIGQIQDSTGTAIGSVSLRSDGTVRITQGATNATTVATISASTDYGIQAIFNQSTGAFSVEFVAGGESFVGPGGNYIAGSGATTGTTARRVQLMIGNGAPTIYIDNLRIYDDAS